MSNIQVDLLRSERPGMPHSLLSESDAEIPMRNRNFMDKQPAINRRDFLARALQAAVVLGAGANGSLTPFVPGGILHQHALTKRQADLVIEESLRHPMFEPTVTEMLAVMDAYHMMLSGAQSDETTQLRKRYFDTARIQRILLEVRRGRASDRIHESIQHELNYTNGGHGIAGAMWRAYRGWVKARVLCCFDPASLPADSVRLLDRCRVDLDELLRCSFKHVFE